MHRNPVRNYEQRQSAVKVVTELCQASTTTEQARRMLSALSSDIIRRAIAGLTLVNKSTKAGNIDTLIFALMIDNK